MDVIRSRGRLIEEPPATVDSESEENLRLVNRLAQSPLTKDQVYIRSMYLCSSQVCETDWCRFSDRALEGICEKVVGESVLAGHDKRSLPVARFFKARIVERPEVADPLTGEPTKWIRAWFYWLKETRGARDLALNMDGGIYREVSISWRYRGGRCSICDGPTRACRHTPGEVHDGNLCFVWIDEVLDVLEGSLVYRGADRETGIAGERAKGEAEPLSELESLLFFEAAPHFRLEARA